MIVSETIQVGTSPTPFAQPSKVVSHPIAVRAVMLRNLDAAATIYIGGPSVTAGTGAVTDGFPVLPGEALPITAVEGTDITDAYAVSTTPVSAAVMFQGA